MSTNICVLFGAGVVLGLGSLSTKLEQQRASFNCMHYTVCALSFLAVVQRRIAPSLLLSIYLFIFVLQMLEDLSIPLKFLMKQISSATR